MGSESNMSKSIVIHKGSVARIGDDSGWVSGLCGKAVEAQQSRQHEDTHRQRRFQPCGTR